MPERVTGTHASCKLTPNADHDKAIRAIEATDGVMSAEPMFPGETDAELASVIAVLLDETKARKALSLLNRRAYIEYARPMADRALIR